ncbi:hypothetical protein OC835_000716 [Tilletia horrida]|uniref:Uncharacterized protein n=1 Tax=Tilletia horrida TaxID=155126 RepID=A0AAN6G590_9BASI|nr:hypothetical protein OC842_007542 [Tilletia horrida]KAK0540313.1 hypothetical protein OC835_000716 [Tilletia horrida]
MATLAVDVAVNALVKKADNADFYQIWANKSSAKFFCASWGCSTDALFGTVISSPSRFLQRKEGAEGLVWSQKASSIASGLTDGSIVWKAPNGTTFGVNIHVPLQIGPFGTAPYYQVQIDGGEWEGSHTSSPYTFPDRIGYKVRVSPQAHHSNLYLTITISDLDDD